MFFSSHVSPAMFLSFFPSPSLNFISLVDVRATLVSCADRYLCEALVYFNFGKGVPGQRGELEKVEGIASISDGDVLVAN